MDRNGANHVADFQKIVREIFLYQGLDRVFAQPLVGQITSGCDWRTWPEAVQRHDIIGDADLQERPKWPKVARFVWGRNLQSISAKDAKYGFGRLIDLARAEPVTVEKHGRPVVVVLSIEEYERLRESANGVGSPKRPRAKRSGKSGGSDGK